MTVHGRDRSHTWCGMPIKTPRRATPRKVRTTTFESKVTCPSCVSINENRQRLMSDDDGDVARDIYKNEGG